MTLWIAGDAEHEQCTASVYRRAQAYSTVTSSVTHCAVRASGPFAATSTPPADTSISHRRGDSSEYVGLPVTKSPTISTRADTRAATLRRAMRSWGAGVERAMARWGATAWGTAPPLEATADARGPLGTLLRMLPAELAGQPGGVMYSRATARSVRRGRGTRGPEAASA